MGREWHAAYERANEALQWGKPQITDRLSLLMVGLSLTLDVVILCRRVDECNAALEHTREVLSGLKLQLNEEKTVVTSFKAGFDFLGFHFTNRGRTIGTKSLRGFYGKVREATRRQQGDRPVAEIIGTLTPLLRGWGQYHRYGQNVGMFTKLDKWVRQRLRAYTKKRWRPPRTWPHESHPTKKEFEQMGLFSLRGILRPHPSQLVIL